MDAPNEQLEKLMLEVHEELRDFGQYLAMRGARTGEQRFGVPEVSMAVLSLVVWTVGKYVSSYLAERAKLDAAKGTKKIDDRIGAIEIGLQRIQEDLRILRDRPSVAAGLIINHSDGTAELVGLNEEVTSKERIDIGATEKTLKVILEKLRRERRDRDIRFVIDEAELISELKALGLTDRSARKAGSRIAKVLTSGLMDLFR